MTEETLRNKEVFVQFSSDRKETLSLTLHSIWKVERWTGYKTAKDRPGEPRILYAFIRTEAGEGRVVAKRGTYLLKPHSLILFDVNEILEYHPSVSPWSYYWYNFTPHNAIPFFKTNTYYSLPFGYDEESHNKNLLNIEYSITESSILLATAIFTQLIYRWIYSLESMKKEIYPHRDEITKALSYINSNLETQYKISDLAKMCYLSERQFRIHFKTHVGISPKTYICTQRLKKIAYHLKMTTYSVKTLADTFNYDSPHQLSREFKKLYGVSPKEYRNSTSPPPPQLPAPSI